MNRAFLDELLDVYGFTPGVQMLIIEMMSRLKIPLSLGEERVSGKSASQMASYRAMPFPRYSS